MASNLLAEFCDELWMNRRLKLNTIVEHLNKALIGNSDLEREQVEDLIRFFKFLDSECAGRDFEQDKQWSELMNLMEISRKLNHRSVRVKDIIKNKSLIEANAKSISRLNQSARLCKSVESSLKELASLVQDCKLELISMDVNDEQDNEFILSQLMLGKNYLTERCVSKVSLLKIELADDLIISLQDSRVELWRNQVEKYELALKLLINFLDSFYKLELSILHLKPLISVEHEPRKEAIAIAGANLSNSIVVCKRKFDQIYQFRFKLIDCLMRKHSSKQRKDDKFKVIVLLNLLNAKQQEFVNDLFTSGLTIAISELDECQRILDEVMATLRLEFGRFYFVNDLELLTIIGLDLRLVSTLEAPDGMLSGEKKRLICKLFNNSINSFVLDNSGQSIIGVKSPLDEVIMLNSNETIALKKKVNIYSVEIVRVLNETIRKLRKSLKSLLLISLKDYDDEEKKINWHLPVQLINLLEYIKFVERVESSLKEAKDLKLLIDFYESRFELLMKEDERRREAENDRLRGIKKSAIISLTVNFISILSQLKAKKVFRVDDWHWQKQVRYYLIEDDEVQVRLANTQFVYKFDFLPLETINEPNSNEPTYKRLINTQISERCFLVASQAMCNLRLGANPYGPAGSGKTETIKALGNLLGCQVIVHNCDETNDAESLNKLIWGLAHTGLWGCFDEFNRLSSSVLSTISSTLEFVQTNLREGKTTVERGSDIMRIDPSSAFFVTLNPGDGFKYKGRRRLPANLRNLFLPISMVRVEVCSIISEYLLTTKAELNAISVDSCDVLKIGQKLSNFLEEMKKLNGSSMKNNRCEWDLRLVLAVLKRLKIYLKNYSNSATLESLLVESLKCEISPRLASDEVEIFNQSLLNIFPKQQHTTELYENENLLAQQLLKFKPNCRDEILKQAIQLYHQLETRMGVLLHGPSKSGKSSTWRLLASFLKKSVSWLSLNPRSYAKATLFGCINQSNQRWLDGVLTGRVREALKILQTSPVSQVWIILDGPIDPDWIESLNSVLDDNQVLTLSSGERLSFALSSSKSIKLIFESSDLQFVSPATISRLGLIHYEKKVGKEVVAVVGRQLESFFNEKLPSKEETTLLIIDSESLLKDHLIYKNYLEYNCSPLTSSLQLLDIIRKAEGCHKYIYIKNVHLIKAQEWSVNSFVEMLRYIVTYGGFYEPDSNNFHSNKCKFILNSPEPLEERILAQALTINSKGKLIPEKIKKISHLSCELFEKDSLVTIELRLNLLGGERRELLDLFKDWKVHEFCNTSIASESMKNLENLLINKEKEKHVFIVSQLELKLLDSETKGYLYHLINFLKTNRLNEVKFLHLIDKLENEDEILFWQSFGTIYSFEKEDNLGEILKVDSISQQQLKWLLPKVEYLVSTGSVKLADKRKFNSFLETLSETYSRSKSNLLKQKRTLINGLNRLAKFEENVEKVKRICNEENDKLGEKRKNIEQLMSDINLALNESEKQQLQLEELKRKFELKTKEFKIRNEKVKFELAKVLPLVEKSKNEIVQHLKPEALNEIKTLRLPPKTIKDILDVLFVLLKIEDSSWTYMKAYLTKNSLKEELTNYDLEKNLTDLSLLSKVENEILSKSESFTKQQAARASKAIVPILEWIQANLEYGKALVKLKPLRDELKQLSEEKEQLDKEAKLVEKERFEIESKLKLDKDKMNQLQVDFDDSKSAADRIKEQLKKALKVRFELEDQIRRWKEKLKLIEFNLEDLRLLKLCCAISTFAIYFNFEEKTLSMQEEFEKLLTTFELNNTKPEKYLTDILNLGVIDSVEHRFSCNSDETFKVLPLVMLNVCTRFNSMIPFIDAERNKLSANDLIEATCFRKILSNSAANVALIKSNDSTELDWKNSLEFASKLNKLIVIELCDAQHDSFYLNMLDLVFKRLRGARIILFGSRNNFDILSKFVQYIDLAAEKEAKRNLSQITSRWLELNNPRLNEEMKRLDSKLEEKRNEIDEQELILLKKLATSSDSVENDDLENGLIRILSDLYASGESIKSDLELLKQTMADLKQRKEEDAFFCEEVNKFYNKHLANLANDDWFCHFSIERYVQLLAKQNLDCATIDIDYSLIAYYAMMPMRLEHRSEFKKQLLSEKIHLKSRKCTKESQLNEIILSLLDEQKQNSFSLSLMTILHDSSKSSPQVEIDELFKGQKRKERNISYLKLYATGDSNSDAQLEFKFSELLSAEKSSTSVTSQGCLCIANAHLSSVWINTRLLQLLESHKRASLGSKKVLIILVAESSINSPEMVFNLQLLNFAQVNYRHDELRLNLSNRFNLFMRTLPAMAPPELIELVRRLVLFHVVCQERTKFKSNRKLTWRHQGYTFDYNQLCLAQQTLHKLISESAKSASPSQLSQLFSHYLEKIIYGSRLETIEDEHSLRELLLRFLSINSPLPGAFRGSKQQLDSKEAESFNSSDDDDDVDDESLANLIGCSES